MCQRIAASMMLVLILPVAVCAYTLVMRSGRQIEIPNSFTISEGTLSYEAAPNLNVTLLLANIDIAATERANGEAPGSLLRRAGAQNQTSSNINPKSSNIIRRQSARTLTNRDFEPMRRAREASEQDYERRRRQLNLPSLEELRRRAEEETERLRERQQESEGSERQQETYWRSRADALRTEIAALDAEINYLRRSLDETNALSFNNAGAIFINSYSNFYPPVYGAGVQVYGRIGFGGGSTRGRIVFGAGNNVNTYQRRIILPPYSYPNSFVYAAPLNYATYDQTVVLARLREREAARANLQARWNALEEEARRAGALPGWLRR
ncbi:MAG: hypothetical protein H0V88_15325 [Pyrinomonadaceae bacterium]|nr:hypothetical protein [Pyrinomonadaceae bacterium]